MTEQNNEIKMSEWLEEEAEIIKQRTPLQGDKIPALKFAENKITELNIDFSKPFNKWTGVSQKGKPITKAIIPCTVGSEKKNWWCNVENPIYGIIISRGLRGQTKFRIFQTGNQDKTKYTLVED